ncbi:hypothetical protein [Rhodococcus sp. NCIMB 12038]|uniref:hypothetical protein n=1 Tax=Rhodococcus sp. NCIMB 12038 TaxID=933800 RepID=UPI000B3CBA71|nr:hypothetical protein [Rhodococcus sp. NCIMB 12038]OUS97381.1 hypothetical protein CA951_03285 [Rhodococcus sp. NCIMB 12038]
MTATTGSVGTPASAAVERWSATQSQGALPEELDPATAHLVDVRGDSSQWAVQCFWLSADDREGKLGVGTAMRPCAVVTPCELCAAGLSKLPAEGREYMAHDRRHAVAGDPAVGYLLHPDLCGMSLVLGDEDLGSSWLGELQRTYGEGLYLVHPAAAPDGTLIGVNPVRVVD